MQKTLLLEIEFITPDHSTREVAFLVLHGDRNVDAKEAFEKLDKDTKREFKTRFDTWQTKINRSDWYHGWNKAQFRGKYSNCFVFENKTTTDRFYGFLCHPNRFDARYELCILINHTEKRQKATETVFLDRVERIRVDSVIWENIQELVRGKYEKALDRRKH